MYSSRKPGDELRNPPALHGPKHWSKDFVEHLRTVHFTLITVCFALILLSTSRSQTEVQIAHDQIREIGELVHGYDPSWFDAPITDAARNAPTGPSVGESRTLVGSSGEPAAENAQSLTGPRAGTFEVSQGVASTLEFNVDSGSLVRVSFRPERYVLTLISYEQDNKERTFKTPADLLHAKVLNTQATLYPPQTLRQFRTLWNLLGDPALRIEVPMSINTTGYFRAVGSVSTIDATGHLRADRRDDFIRRPVKLKLITTGKQQTVELFRGKNYWAGTDHWVGQFSIYPPAQLRDLGDLATGAFLYQTLFQWIGPDGGASGQAELLIPVASDRAVQFDGQSVLIAHAKKPQNWKHGDFDYAFRQLSNITKDYEALDLITIEKVLAGEEKRTGESFEILGIKFPAENTTRWGILVIIGVQIYFWIHLRELSPKLRPNDPGWDVAWIGVYSSKYAKVATFVSTCLLPVSAALALGIRGLSVSSFARSSWVLLVLGALATLTLSLAAWNRLPRVNESPKA